MTLPRLAGSGCAFDRRLLRAAQSEVPTEGAEARALAAAAVAMRLGAAMACPVAPRATWTLGRAIFGAKWLGVALAVVAGAGATASTLSERGRPVRGLDRAPAALRESSAPVWVTASPVVLAASAPPAPAPSTPARPAPAPRTAALPARGEAPSLSEETLLVQAASRALASRQPDEALSVIATYQSRYPRGEFAREARFLRALALVARGEEVEGKRIARELLEESPDGVLAPQLQAVLGGAGEGR